MGSEPYRVDLTRLRRGFSIGIMCWVILCVFAGNTMAKQVDPPAAPSPSNAAGQPSASVHGASTWPDSAQEKQLLAKLVPKEKLDVQAKRKQLLDHVGAVLLYYRGVSAPVQQVGEAIDSIYHDQAINNAKAFTGYTFKASVAEARLLALYQHLQSGNVAMGSEQPRIAQSEATQLRALLTQVNARAHVVAANSKSIKNRMAKATPTELPALRSRLERNNSIQELNLAESDALGQILKISTTNDQAGLAADIELLQRTSPEIANVTSKAVIAAPENLRGASSEGGNWTSRGIVSTGCNPPLN